MNKRAITPEQKKQITDDLLKLWLEVPELRLGQFILNCSNRDLFYIEDQNLIDECSEFVKLNKDH